MSIIPTVLQDIQCPACSKTTTAYVETDITIDLPADDGRSADRLQITVKPAMVVCIACGTTVAPLEPAEEPTP